MKTNEIKIGETYLTKIGEWLCKVVVVSETTGYWSGRTAYVVRRTNEDKPLPKPRHAAALRPLRVVAVSA